jgi:hypothetical protein
MKSINDLQATGAAQRRAAHALADAAQELARTANGVQESVMPAPVAYSLLGDIKVTAACLRDVAEFLPRGLAASLGVLTVYDRGGDPRHQVDAAAVELCTIVDALAQIVGAADMAQAVIAYQGYEVQ